MPSIKEVVCKTIDIATDDLADLSITTAKIAADAVDGAKIADDAVSLEHLDAGIKPSHIVVYAGEVTTAGGDASESETVSGVLATDLVVGSIHTEGSTPVTLDRIVASTNTISSTWSADPSTDHVYTYIVYRAVA